jgi:hypothetical protein
MRNIKSFVRPVITGATGIVTGLRKLSGNNTRKSFRRFSKKKKKKAVIGT